MMNILNGGKHADSRRGPAGVHGDAGRRRELLRGAAHGRGDLSRAQESAARPRPLHRLSATRAASRPNLSRQRGGHRASSSRPSSRRATRPASDVYAGAGPGRQRAATTTASTSSSAKASCSDWRRDGGLLAPAWSTSIPIISIEDGCREDDWDGWKLLTDAHRRPRPARRRRPVRHQHRAPAARHRDAAPPTRS